MRTVPVVCDNQVIHDPAAACLSFWANRFTTVRPKLSVRYTDLSVLSGCLSVTLVYCGQTVQSIKMKLGTEVGLGAGDIVLDRDPAPLTKKDTAPNFWPMPIATKRLDVSGYQLYRGRPRPRDIVFDGDTALPPKGAQLPSPIFGPCLLWPNGWMHQAPLSTEVGLDPGDTVLDGDSGPP